MKNDAFNDGSFWLRFFVMVLLSFTFLGLGKANAQEIKTLESFLEESNIGPSDHFSDLLYGGKGLVEVFGGKVPDSKKSNPKTLLIEASDLHMLNSALSKYPSIELVRINVGGGAQKSANLSEIVGSNLKYILFVTPLTIDSATIGEMVKGISDQNPIQFLIQISRPG